MSSGEAKAGARGRWRPSGSLAWRLAAWTALGAMAIVFSVAVAMYLAMIAQLRSIDEQVLMKRALSVREIMQTETSIAEWLPHEVSEDLEGPRRVYIRVMDARGVVIAETPGMSALAAASAFQPPRRDGSARAEDISGAGGTLLRGLSLAVETPGLAARGAGMIQIAVDTSLDEALLARFRFMLLALFAPALLGSVAVAMFIATTFLAPLRRMAREAECINADQRGRRLIGEGAIGELAEVRAAFNGVLERLEAARERLRRYADNVAHEIRTPLNRMLLRCELAARDAGLTDEQKEMLDKQIQDCGALSNLAQRLLFLSRAEGNRIELEGEPLGVARELDVLRGYFEAGAEDAGVSLTTSVAPPSLELWAERALFQQCIGNLVTNALAHCPAGGSIQLLARARDGGVELSVADTGSGIGEEMLPLLFDRFASGEGRSDGRIGLGLAIVKSILDLHGGAIEAESKAGQGTIVRTWWPTAKPGGATFAPAAATAV